MKLPMFKFFIFRKLHLEESVVCDKHLKGNWLSLVLSKLYGLLQFASFASPFMNAPDFPVFLSSLFYHIAKIHLFFK